MPFPLRADSAREEKSALARAAAAYLLGGGTVALDTGTTVLPLGALLTAGTTCITPSLPVTTVGAGRGDLHLLSPGGDYDDSKLNRAAPVRFAGFAEINQLLVTRPRGASVPEWLLDEETLGCSLELVEVDR